MGPCACISPAHSALVPATMEIAWATNDSVRYQLEKSEVTSAFRVPSRANSRSSLSVGAKRLGIHIHLDRAGRTSALPRRSFIDLSSYSRGSDEIS